MSDVGRKLDRLEAIFGGGEPLRSIDPSAAFAALLAVDCAEPTPGWDEADGVDPALRRAAERAADDMQRAIRRGTAAELLATLRASSQPASGDGQQA